MNVDGALPLFFAARPASTGISRPLGTAHARILLFDSREPLLPLAVGCKSLHQCARESMDMISVEGYFLARARVVEANSEYFNNGASI